MHRSSEEIAEIERHKYFLSEKQGHDVGWEFAERDWETSSRREVASRARRQPRRPTAISNGDRHGVLPGDDSDGHRGRRSKSRRIRSPPSDHP